MTTTATPAIGNELFVHNMRVLWRRDPLLAQKIDAIGDAERYPHEQTKSGHATARIKLENGKSAYLHSRYDPIQEARRFAEGTETDKKFCIVVSGFGLGYHIEALLDHLRGDAVVVCTEPSLRLIATALACVDLADVLGSERLILITDTDKATLHDKLQIYNTLMMLGTQFVSHAASTRLDARGHAALTRTITEFITFTRMSLLTLVSNSRITCKNIAMNLVSYVSTPPINLLRNRFAGDPAIVVSAGPSLARHLDRLGEFKGRAVLCAVQTALGPMLRRGIVPDFATSLDFHAMSRKFFEDIGDLSHTHLVAEPKATWHVVDDYPGPVSLLDNEWARMVLGESLGRRDGLQAGATVAHLAFYLAVYMGCDPIIFVGQDLAFTGHVFYVPGVEVHRTWQSELNRFHSMEHKEWERIARNRPILRKVPGHDGGELYTDELLLTYLEQFEKDIAQVSATIINATEGGARIRGAESMTLFEAEKRYCTKPIDPERFAYRQTTRWRDATALPDTREAVAKRIEELDDAVTLCDELLTVLNELNGLTHDPDRFNKRLVQVDELRARVYRDGRTYRIVNAATQLAELRRFSADRQLSVEDISDDAERAKRQLARDIDFITAVRDGTLDVQPILQDALQRIERAIRES